MIRNGESVKARHFILNIVVSTLAWPLRTLWLVCGPFLRVMNLIRAKTKLPRVSSSVQFDGTLDIVGTANINVGEYSRIGNEVQLGTEQHGEISVGKHVRVNRGTTIFSYSSIAIGDYTIIGEFVTIRDANHGIRRGEHIKGQEHDTRPISIGQDVWIGRGACILPGVCIGDGSVVGANSVVTKSIPPNTIAAGVPARVLRER